MRKQTLLKKVSARLERFLKPIFAACDKVRGRFVRQAVSGILASGSVVVTEMARQIHDRTRALDYTAKRLCRELKAETWNLDRLQDAYLESVAPLVTDTTVIAVDLTDLVKPRGRHFEHLALVRDGDKDDLKPGYWCMEAYAACGDEPLPLILEPFSVEDPKTPSQNLVIVRTLARLHRVLAGRGIYAFDRGFDGGEILKPLLDKQMRFVLRLRGDRHLVLPNGVHLPARQIAEHLHPLKKCLWWRRKKRRFQDHYVGYKQVRLPGRDEPLWLVVSIVPGKEEDRVMILLTNLPVTNFGQAKRILRYYRRRWKAEDGIRLMKQQVRLEGFRIRSLRAIRRLCWLALLAIAFLVTLSLKTLSLAERVAARAQPLRRATGMILYRLARGTQDLLTGLSRHDLYFLRSFQNG